MVSFTPTLEEARVFDVFGNWHYVRELKTC